MKSQMLKAAKVADRLGEQRVTHLHGATFKDSSTIIVTPTRGMIHRKVVQSWMGMIAPMNQKRHWMIVEGHEVGKAYDAAIEAILAHPELSKWKYVMTVEDDNVQPPDAQIRLLESIDQFGFDAVSGIYFTKGDINMPMAYGDPEKYRTTGVLDFAPRNIAQALQQGNVMSVNGIGMGCALWRLDMFKKLPKPWFVTLSDYIDGKGVAMMTQDLFFAERAVRAGKRFGVDMRVRVGHIDTATGTVY